ncbi:helix-turn-helix domain-containing protein [Nonomuraea sp. CA-218870]|uniref:helix-turn-helix domain-containing protein n=1 Tax=Nonomuraea sp. CA-218870 TaxID=3239998 RepID=UPI003D8B6834
METTEMLPSTESTQSAACSRTPTPFMPVKEAVALLPVSKAYLYTGLRAGRFPGTTFGRARVLLRSFVEEFVSRVEAGERITFEDYAADWRTRDSSKATV